MGITNHLDITVERSFITIVFIVVSANCETVSDIKKYDPNYEKTWMFFPDGNGTPHVIDLIGNVESETKFISNFDSKVTMFLYNKQYRWTPIYLKTSGSNSATKFTLDKRFDSRKRTKFVIHDFDLFSSSADSIQLIKNAYLDEREDFNLIAVDWGEIADYNYFTASGQSRHVGRNLAMVIDHMVTQRNAKLGDIHVIGHSLGAHVAGFAGMYLQKERRKKIVRISGLDPALPMFENLSDPDNVLDRTDAEFVDVIHTCSGSLGHDENLGHADFFPYGGRSIQPDCNIINDLFGVCSHGMSYQYFSWSIRSKNRFKLYTCRRFDAYDDELCVSLHGNPVLMGDSTPVTARGRFYSLQTRMRCLKEGT